MPDDEREPGARVVAEQSLVARLARPDLPGLCPLARERRRTRWGDLDPGATADALTRAGDALVVARPRAVDPGAAALWVVARAHSREVLRLPGDASRAAWMVGVAARLWALPAPRVRRLRALQVLSGAVAAGACDPASRGQMSPAALTRWAAAGWSPCRHCGAGGLLRCPCGACGLTVGEGRP